MLLKNNINSVVTFFQIILIIPLIRALYQECEADDYGYGVCVYEYKCKLIVEQKGSLKSVKGSCSDRAPDIKCCIKTVTKLKDGTELSTEGRCKVIDDNIKNTYDIYDNECPGDNTIKLCVPKVVYHYKVGVRTMDVVKAVKNYINNDSSYNDLDSIMKCLEKHKESFDWGDWIRYWEGKLLQHMSKNKLGQLTYDLGDNIGKKLDDCVDIVVDIINIRHVAFSIDNYIYEYNVYNDIMAVYCVKNSTKEIETYNWDYLSYLSGTTDISPEEMLKKINNKLSTTENFKTVKQEKWADYFSFENGRYNLFLNNCHDFVLECLKIVQHNPDDLNKFITFKKKMADDTLLMENLKSPYTFNSEQEFRNWFSNTSKDLIYKRISECDDPKEASIAFNNDVVTIEPCNMISADTLYDNEPETKSDTVNNEYDTNTYESSNDNQLYNEQEKDNSNENKKSPWLWIGIGIGIFVLILIIIICVCCCKH